MLNEKLKEKLKRIKLQDGPSETGGISFAGETLQDFLEETGMENASIEEINKALIKCGIAPLPLLQDIAYEKYQLDWMMSHNYSLQEVFQICQNATKEFKKNNMIPDDVSYLTDYFEEQGFKGEIYASKNEFLNAEYNDVEYMLHLLTKEEFFEYMQEKMIDYEYFEVSRDGTVNIMEYGYFAGASATDNPEETCRIVNCSNFSFKLADLSGNIEADNDLFEYVGSNSKQYIDDIMEQDLQERIYKLLSIPMIKFGKPTDQTISPGSYLNVNILL